VRFDFIKGKTIYGAGFRYLPPGSTLAITAASTVYDPTTPTPVLMHELAQVKQFRDNYETKNF
jgi:hypothetical protein